MNKKIIAKRTFSVLVVGLVLIMLLASGMSSFMGSARSSAFINEYQGNLKTNMEDYLNPAVVQALPDNVKDTDIISVIINLDRPALMDAYSSSGVKMSITEYALSGAADQIRAQVSSDKADILKALDKKGIHYQTGANYSTVISGFEILIKAGDFKDACAVLTNGETPIVGEVYEPAEAQLVENTVNVYENTGIFDSSNFKYDGTGMVIAVLDTGLDYTHSAFSVENFNVADKSKLGLTKETVAALLAANEFRAEGFVSNITANDLYVNEKVPFAFDYADKDSDVYSLHNNHGTHVSGVIAGKDDVITGVAPNAQIVSMKTFSDVEESARTSWILSALEDCVLLGVDVINMSLGTACGFSRETDKETVNGNVYQKIRDAGISLVVAASNSYNSAYGSEKNGNLGLTSNPDTSTVGSPSTYDGAMSVASINGKKTPYILFGKTIIYFIEATNASSKEKDFFEELLKDRLPAGSQEAIEIPYVVIPGAGRPADYTGLDVKGKIALVRRGSTTFEEKANAAQAAGAAAVIIYNNVSGDIKMNAGTITIPICSISQDDGEMLASKAYGTIKFSRAQTSGPFISDFSSWGPAPDLSIKPEITAHGGNILSAVTGGDYDRLSGTSMACPNMAGAIALMRQYVENEYASIGAMPEGAEKSKAINALVNCLVMSTADVIYNTNGLPYAVRKQGAGLANLVKAAGTKAYIQTYDRLDGSVMDKSKIELGDDPSKTGVYTLKFAINNFGDTSLTYKLSATVMTEGVSETETVRGETTVTEEGYLLNGAKFELVSVTNGTKSGTEVTVGAGETAVVVTKITLTDANKKYLDSSFENGMYVEGFVHLDATKGTDIDMGVPYLAFYGDWTAAPMFDLDYFETNKDELDNGISQDDKIMADAYATRPIGGLSSDYVSYLGSYYFQQNPKDKVIAANRDYVALSYADETVHALRFVWAGILRNAQRIVITITDDATGEVIFQTVDYDVRKSYGDGGSIYPANIEIEFDTQDYNLKNNSKLNVKLEGYMDYENDGANTNKKNTFEFPMYLDFEAPAVTDCEFYTKYDKTLKKDRLFARVAVYDNHYAMAMNVGYVAEATDEEKAEGYDSVLRSFESYLTPIYSERNGTTYVEYELTDYIYEIKENARNKNTFIVTCYDYALNTVTYEIALPDEYIDFYFEEANSETTYLSVNQVYQLNPVVYPNAESDPENANNPWGELIEYNSTNKNVIRIVNDKIVAVGPGEAYVQAKDPISSKSTQFKVTVVDSGPHYKKYDKPVADIFEVNGYETKKAYYYLSTDERDIGMTGDTKMFEGGFSLKMFPSESVELLTKFVPYFEDDTEIVYETNNKNIVEIDKNGVVTAKKEGFSSVTVKVLLDGKSTFYSETINVEVKNPWIRSGPSLTHYFGLGGEIVIPEYLNLTEIGQYAFSNFDYVDKGPEDEISEEEPDATKIVFIGEKTFKKVVIPNGVEKIGPYAFAGLEALEEIVIPSTVEAIEYGAFYGCKNLKTITFLDENGEMQPNGLRNVKLINMSAFEGCNIRGAISLDNARAIGDYAFAGNTRLTQVTFPKTLRSIGGHAFAGNTALTTVKVKADTVKYVPYVFTGCTALRSVSTVDENGIFTSSVNAAVIPTGMFYGCKSLTSLTVGKDVHVIGEYALARTGIAKLSIEDGNTAFLVQKDANHILSRDGTELVLVAPTVAGVFQLDGNITSIGLGAFAENTGVTAVTLPNVTRVNKYAFAECTNLASVTLGALTEIGDYAFFGTALATHPSFDNVSEIGKYAFAESGIKTVVIPNGVKVNEGAFCECDSLESITLGDNVDVGYGAFSYNNRLTGRWEMSFYSKNNKRHYYYDYKSPIKSIVIGNNVTLGHSAFMGAADIEAITFGENITVGEMAFFNTPALKKIVDHNGQEIGLTTVTSIGARAFSGDEQYVFSDSFASNIMITGGAYVFHYYGSAFEEIDLTNVESLGTGAFYHCTALKKVTLGESIKVIPEFTFSGCSSLEQVNLENVEEVKSDSFTNTPALKVANLSSAKDINRYAFTMSGLESVTLNADGTSIGEGAFGYCESLVTVNNLNKSKEIGSYAFAYTGITEIDLTSAVSIGETAFIKENITPVKVTLGKDLVSLGDNPFAFCLVDFTRKENVDFNGNTIERDVTTYDVSKTVKVIDGSLYATLPNGLELITYAGDTDKLADVCEGTVRVSAYAFAGSEVKKVQLPLSLNTIGHKAFFACDKLTTVIFKSYEAPILEEELDVAYYNSFDNIPATGEFGFESYDGSVEIKTGLGIVDYFMWNVPSGLYYDVYFGANFIDYIGHIDRRITMVRPSNGQHYDTFIYSQYFDTVIDGAVAATDDTLAAIDAIAQIPDKVRLTHESIVVAARQAYDKLTLKEQQALVTDYTRLVSAENRIKLLKGDTSDTTPDTPETKPDVPESKPDTPDTTPDSKPETPDTTPDSTVTTDSNVTTDTADTKPQDTTPDSNGENNEPKDSSNTGLIVVIVILSVLVVAGGAAIVVLVLKRNGKFPG